jgi:hypothetical protein
MDGEVMRNLGNLANCRYCPVWLMRAWAAFAGGQRLEPNSRRVAVNVSMQ